MFALRVTNFCSKKCFEAANFFLQRLNPEVEKMGQSCVDVRKLSTQTE